MKKTALVILADGFEEIEAVTPIDVLRRAGAEVITAGLGKKQITGAHGITITCDTTLADVHLRPVDAVVLPGGNPGTQNLLDSDMVLEVVSRCFRDNCVTAAVCAAPQILDKAGALHGREFTCYPGIQEKIAHGTFKDLPAVTSGNVVTGKSAGCSAAFSLAVAAAVCGKESADAAAQKIVLG